MAQGETDIALRNGQRVMAILNQYGLRNFWVLSSGGHEWANWRRYLHRSQRVYGQVAAQSSILDQSTRSSALPFSVGTALDQQDA